MKWFIRAALAAVAAALLRSKVNKPKPVSEKPDMTESSEITTLPTPRKAFDISNFWLSFTPSMATAVKLLRGFIERGFSGVMIGVHYKALDIARLQYEAAGRVGLWTDTFVYQFFDDQDFFRLDPCREFPGGICWIDCEWRGDEDDNAINEMTQEEVNWHIWRRVEYVKALGLVPGIYTQKSWWVPYTGNNTWFAEQGIPLWDANDQKYDPYGGWFKPLWTQYAWDQKVNSVNCDLSIEGTL